MLTSVAGLIPVNLYFYTGLNRCFIMNAKERAQEDFIYLDNNATTPLDPIVLDAMLPYMTTWYANPSSRHYSLSAYSLKAIEKSRARIAEILGVEDQEIVFTSGATESLNMAILGVAAKYRGKGMHIISFRTEHRAVLEPLDQLARKGYDISYCPVLPDGSPDLTALSKLIRKDTILVVAMWVNNETGVLFPMDEIGEICRNAGVILLSDATQAAGKMPLHPKNNFISLMAFSAHKMNGPKGIGALYISRRNPRIQLEPIISGGGQEFGFRAGTLNVPGIVGLSAALSLATESSFRHMDSIGSARETFENALMTEESVIQRTVSRSVCMPHVSHLHFPGVRASSLLSSWYHKLGASAGSSCSSGETEPSHVLMAMGIDRIQAFESLRFSFGRQNTPEEALRAAFIVLQSYRSLKKK
jgi:cysteine desulfurase